MRPTHLEESFTAKREKKRNSGEMEREQREKLRNDGRNTRRIYIDCMHLRNESNPQTFLIWKEADFFCILLERMEKNHVKRAGKYTPNVISI